MITTRFVSNHKPDAVFFFFSSGAHDWQVDSQSESWKPCYADNNKELKESVFQAPMNFLTTIERETEAQERLKYCTDSWGTHTVMHILSSFQRQFEIKETAWKMIKKNYINDYTYLFMYEVIHSVWSFIFPLTYLLGLDQLLQ